MGQFRDSPGDISNRERSDSLRGGNAGDGFGRNGYTGTGRATRSTATGREAVQQGSRRYSGADNPSARANQAAARDMSDRAQNAGYAGKALGFLGGLVGGPVGAYAGKQFGEWAGSRPALSPADQQRAREAGMGSGSSRVGDMQPKIGYGGQFGGNYGSAPGTQNGEPQQQGGALQPWQQAGQSALQQQQALLGMGGQESQQQAFEAFGNSPGQQFLRDRQQKALMRNSAAMGGLGGGNVRTALQEQAAGNAAQDYSNQFNRLGAMSGQGFQATTAGLDENFRNRLNEQQLNQMNQQRKAGKTEGILNLVGQFNEPIGDMFSGIGDSVSDWMEW